MITWLYFITFAATVLLMGISIFKNKRVDTSYILFCFMIFFNAMGRWLVAASETVEQAVWANKMLYLGGCYTPLLLIIVLARISDIRLSSVLKVILTFYSTLVFGLVMTIGYSGIYYKSVRLEEGIGYHYLVKEYGPAHHLYPIMLILYVILLILLLVKAFLKRKTIAFGTVFSIGIVGSVVILSYLLTRLTNSSIEWVSIGYLISVLIISKLFDQMNRYDMSTNIAVAVASANENGFIVFDSKKRYVNSNNLIKQLYPEISEWQVEAVPPKSGSYFSDEIIRWFLDNGSTKEHKMVHTGENYYEISVRDITSGRRNKKVGYLMEAADRTAEQNYTMKVEEIAHIASEANMAKSSFLAQMSHEIRTPINAVLGMNEMILRETKEKATLEYASNAYNAGNALLSIINDILDISKIEAGKLEIIEADYDLFSLISDCYHMTVERARKKGLELRVSCDETLPSHFKGDMFHIRQIVVNFLTNAIKYTDKGFAELVVSGEKRESGFLLRFAVRDTGIGLKPESIEKLFTNFQRFDLERNQSVEGTGLGLSICKQLSELMGGSVRAESVYGEGSTFICEIPQQMMSDAPIGKLDLDVSAEGLDISRKNRFTAPDARILVVDDVEMNIVVFKSFLKEHKMQIDTAMSGRECLSLLQNNKYDVIFLDHMMPEMDGMETFAKMREQNLAADTPVVMLTANAISGEKEKYLAAGFSSYLSKPIKSEKLDETLLEFISPEKIAWSEKAEKAEEKPVAVSENAELMDVSLGILYSAKSEDVYREILKSYIKNSGEQSEKLRRYCDKKDFRAYVIEVHALKGTSLNIGARKLSEAAKELELAGKNGDYALIENKNGALLELYEKVLVEARKYLGKETHKIEDAPSEISELSFDEFSKLIVKIKAACAEYDSSEISALCREGGAYSCGGIALKPIFDDIKASADDFECEEAAKKAEAALKKLR